MSDLIDAHLGHFRSALSRDTLSTREVVLRRADRDLPLGLYEASTEELAEWLATPGWSRWTRCTYYGHLTAFYRWACDPGRSRGLDWDPSAGLARPPSPKGLPRPVSRDQFVFALAVLPAPWPLLVRLAGQAGLRAAEIAALDRSDATERAITVVNGKGGKDRVVPTHPELWAALRGLPPGPVARDARRIPMTAYQVSHRASDHLTRIGLTRVTMHKFRHWFATELVAQGVNLLVVAELLGHANVNTTKVYALVTSEQREMAIRALPALAPVPS